MALRGLAVHSSGITWINAFRRKIIVRFRTSSLLPVLLGAHRVGSDFECFELFPEARIFILKMLVVVFELLVCLSELASGVFTVLVDTILNTFSRASTTGRSGTITLVEC